jgi:hypothetical protein
MDGTNPLDVLASLGLEADTEDTTTDEVVEATSSETVDTPTDSTEGQESSDTNVVNDETESSEGVTEEQEIVDTIDERVYAGKYKSVEDLENAYQEAQRKMHEEAQQRAAYEAYLQTIANQNNQPAQPQFSSGPSNQEELIEYAYENPDEAFWFAAENAPHLTGRVIAEIRQFDPARAEELSFQYQQSLYEQRLQEMQQPILQMQTQAIAQQAHAEIAGLPHYSEVKSDMASILRERPYLINMESPELLKRGLRDAYELALAKAQPRLAAADTAVRQQREQASGVPAVETGGNIETPPVDEVDPATELRNSIFNAANTSW